MKCIPKYTQKPKFTKHDIPSFSGNGYECKNLMLTPKGAPAALLKSDKHDGVWSVRYGNCSLYFRTYEEAMAYCREHFRTLDGKPVTEETV